MIFAGSRGAGVVGSGAAFVRMTSSTLLVSVWAGWCVGVEGGCVCVCRGGGGVGVCVLGWWSGTSWFPFGESGFGAAEGSWKKKMEL